MNDDRRKVSALLLMCVNFGQEMQQDWLRLWLDLLRPYGADLVEQAVRQVVQHYEYRALPPFAIMRRELDRLCHAIPDERVLETMAEAEWQLVLEQVRVCGWMYEPDISHPTTRYVIRGMGGWSAINSWRSCDMDWNHRRFVTEWMRADDHVDAMKLGAAGIESARQAALTGAAAPAGARCIGQTDGAPVRVAGRALLERLEKGGGTRDKG